MKKFYFLPHQLLFFILFSGIMGRAQVLDSLADTLRPKLNNSVETGSVIKSPTDKWFAQDKFLHFYFCASIVGLSYHTLANRFNHDENQSKIISVSFTALVGLGKEIYDKKKKGHFSWKDLCWDGAGLTVGYFAFVHRY